MLYLLERLSVSPRRADGRREPLDPADAAVAQIQRIAAIARRVEDGVAQVPWGLPAPVEMGAAASVRLDVYAQALADAIARHEPRLSAVKVEVERTGADHVGTDQTGGALAPYRLRISALFPGEDQPRDVRVPAPY